MKIPEEIFTKIKNRLWAQADRDDWISLSDQQKSGFYEQWSTAKEVGVLLARFMEPAQVRVYLKDTIMKPYARERTSDAVPVLKAVGLNGDELSIKNYVKPHGRQLFDKRVVSWGQARDWKAILFAVYERAYRSLGKPHAVVLFRATGKMAQPSERKLVEDLRKRLGIEKIIWVD
jgi:hypothetical protein